MEIIGEIAVKRNRRDNAKKMWLTIGLIAFVITMVFELVLGNFSFLALLIPFAYLLNLRNKMGKGIFYKAVTISFKDNDCSKKIEISNCEYHKNVLYSVCYEILDNARTEISCSASEGKIIITCVAQKTLFSVEKTISDFKERTYDIVFYVLPQDVQNIANKIQLFLT